MKGDPFMDPEDFEKARLFRERQNPIHPDIRQETDASKEARRPVIVRSVKVKQQHVWDSETHSFKFY